MIDKVFKFCENRLPMNELPKLYSWVNESERNRVLFAEVKSYYTEKNIALAKRYSYKEREKIIDEIYNRKGWYRKVVFRPNPAIMVFQGAVSLLVVSSIILGLILFSRQERERIAGEYLEANIKSANRKAVLTLSSGEELVLGAKENKSKTKRYEIDDDGSMVKINEKSKEMAIPSESSVNTISTELGGFYSATLPDGSEVWINSKSTLSFSDDFGKSERRVSLSGEAYFTVVRDENKPFIVSVNNRDVRVLGTEFNVKAYKGEDLQKISLVKGSVKYCDNISGETRILTPNNMLIINNSSGEITECEFDPYVFGAWRDGYFLFLDESLEDILKMMSRWFNIEIRLENDDYNLKRFNGKISREMGIMPLMSKLQISYKFRYYMEDGTLIIK